VIRNIIWDVDGTLFDTYPPIAMALQNAIKKLGKDAPLQSIEKLTKISLSECIKTLSSEYELGVEEIEREFKNEYSRVSAKESPPFKWVKEICEYIKSISGKNVIITHRGKEGLEELLSAYGMKEDFEGYFTRDDGYPRKPDPTSFHKAIEKYDLQKQETINIGDREIDIVAGQNAGIFSCLFGSIPNSVKPELVVNNFEDLHKYIIEQNKDQV
jgi:phosphoglycolate phosphatase-like HAD superfamily hydrolase